MAVLTGAALQPQAAHSLPPTGARTLAAIDAGPPARTSKLPRDLSILGPLRGLGPRPPAVAYSWTARGRPAHDTQKMQDAAERGTVVRQNQRRRQHRPRPGEGCKDWGVGLWWVVAFGDVDVLRHGAGWAR